MKLIAGWNGGKSGPTCPNVEGPCCGPVFYTPMGLGTETDVIVVSDVSQARSDWKADQIALRVNNHERLVEALRNVKYGLESKLVGSPEFTLESMIEGVSRALAALEAGKGGE